MNISSISPIKTVLEDLGTNAVALETQELKKSSRMEKELEENNLKRRQNLQTLKRNWRMRRGNKGKIVK